MMGPCMCGDPYCPSCGPAQGYNLAQEELAEAVQDALERHLLACPACAEVWDQEELAEWLADLLMENAETLAPLLAQGSDP